jgi:hypothetical protein
MVGRLVTQSAGAASRTSAGPQMAAPASPAVGSTTATLTRMTALADLKTFPGGDLVQRGLADLSAGRESVEALLVSVGGPRLKSVGIEVHDLQRTGRPG